MPLPTLPAAHALTKARRALEAAEAARFRGAVADKEARMASDGRSARWEKTLWPWSPEWHELLRRWTGQQAMRDRIVADTRGAGRGGGGCALMLTRCLGCGVEVEAERRTRRFCTLACRRRYQRRLLLGTPVARACDGCGRPSPG